MIFILCLAELLQCFSSYESCVTGCHSFHLDWTLLHTSGSLQASNHDRTASVLARHTSWRRRSAERLHGSFVTVKTHASLRLSGHCARVNRCFSVFFFCVRHSTRTQFLHASGITDHRIHSVQAHPSQRSTAAAGLQASLAARLHGKLCEISFKTHFL